MITPTFLHYLSVALPIALGVIGGGIGLGIAVTGSQEAFDRQPMGSDTNFRAMIIGLALIESGTVIALVTSLLMLFSAPKEISFGVALAELGAALAVGIACAASSIGSSFAVKASAKSITRQPFMGQKILTLMLICQSLIEAIVVFAFIIALLIRAHIHDALSMTEGIKLLSAGLVIALGSIGPSIGQAIFTNTACASAGINKNSYAKIFPFTFFSATMIETALIFCLLFALIIIYTPIDMSNITMQTVKFITSALTIGIGSIGTAVGLGYVTAKGSAQITHNPENYTIILRSTLLAIAFIESSVIYALIVALLLMMKV